MSEKYGNFLNGLSKFERMLKSSTSLSHRRVLQGYYLRLRDESVELGLDRNSDEKRRLRGLFEAMTVKMRWQYHPVYCRSGVKWLNTKGLSRFWKKGELK